MHCACEIHISYSSGIVPRNTRVFSHFYEFFLQLQRADPHNSHNTKQHTNNMQKIKNILHHNTNKSDDTRHHTLGGLLHRHKEEEHLPVSEPILSDPLPASELVQRQELHDELLVKKEILTTAGKRESLDVERSEVMRVGVIEPVAATTVIAEPLNVKHVEKDVVVHEHIHPVEKEEIQPIIHREREQMEVRQITERLHETEIQPTLIEKRDLAPEVREVMVERSAPIPENIVLPSVSVDATLRSVETHAPIVNEVIKKTVIEEVQPVLEKDVIVPTIIQETKPIYEKIVEAPVLIREELPVREITREKVIIESEVLKGKASPLLL
ncbi:hypothetical protein PROFUN_08944 [Planoprotostelium fungivorum]|uniref:Uncharacterized protein n=1 Tax=Planoprotostelium fungivorum TaxID=1890364 RepID=A0A2P6NIS0_9EUKA|nr:hypothetical protein PROFUN_08944 [Planoprotostelium fungivorum]